MNHGRRIWGRENSGGCAHLKMNLWFQIKDGVWCFRRLLYRFSDVMRSLLRSCGVSSPFYNSPFFSAGRSSCHFVRTRAISIDRPFLLFPRHIFSSFSRRKLLSAILLLLFMFPPYRLHDFGLLFQASFICNIIIISWEGEDINGVH